MILEIEVPRVDRRPSRIYWSIPSLDVNAGLGVDECGGRLQQSFDTITAEADGESDGGYQDEDGNVA